MHVLSRTLARTTDFRRNLQILQVGEFQHQVLLHLRQEFRQGSFEKSLDDVFFLEKIEGLLSHAEFANLIFFVVLLLSLHLLLRLLISLATTFFDLVLLLNSGLVSGAWVGACLFRTKLLGLQIGRTLSGDCCLFRRVASKGFETDAAWFLAAATATTKKVADFGAELL